METNGIKITLCIPMYNENSIINNPRIFLIFITFFV
jgi:hypothetical protein